MRYYVHTKNELGFRQVICETEGMPVDMDGVDIIDLPNGDELVVKSRNKSYPAYKIARAIAEGQIDISDIGGN